MDLELHILNNRDSKNIFPKLKVLNGVSMDIDSENKTVRQAQRRVAMLMEKLSMFVGSYSVQQGPISMPVYYMQDEVGSSVQHSDSPNVRCVSFVYSPKNEEPISYNILWPVRDIDQSDAIYRDFLDGFTEQQFRSARLHTWFTTPETFYNKALTALRAQEAKVDVETEHQRIQDNCPLRGSLDLPKIKVYTEDAASLATLTDPRFELTEFEGADVHWLLSIQRGELLKHATGFINQFPEDDVLLRNDLLVSLVHSTYKCFKTSSDHSDESFFGKVIPESYFVSTQLPAIMGRHLELESQDFPPLWQVVRGDLP